jgi:hypothetical protein
LRARESRFGIQHVLNPTAQLKQLTELARCRLMSGHDSQSALRELIA